MLKLYVRPHVDYGDVIYHILHSTLSAKDSVRINFGDERAPKFFPMKLVLHQNFGRLRRSDFFVLCSKISIFHPKIYISINYFKFEALSSFHFAKMLLLLFIKCYFLRDGILILIVVNNIVISIPTFVIDFRHQTYCELCLY